MGVYPEYFTWDDVREVHRLGYAVGAHGWSHKFLTQCSPQELDKELVSSKKTLEDQLGAPVTTISFPGGRYNKAVLQACADAGYTSLYTSDAWASNTAATVKVYGRMTTTRNMRGEDLVRVLQCGGKPPLATRLTVSAKSTAKKLLGDNLYYRLWSVLARSRRREGMG
jgi:peptidoglycan/xylan/chitin deacetylase (PgdA/CDA1 family)